MESLSTFTREKKIVCGKRYMEVDIIPRTIKGDAAAKRARKDGRRSHPQNNKI